MMNEQEKSIDLMLASIEKEEEDEDGIQFVRAYLLVIVRFKVQWHL